jgi:hypothetical protein
VSARRFDFLSELYYACAGLKLSNLRNKKPAAFLSRQALL